MDFLSVTWQKTLPSQPPTCTKLNVGVFRKPPSVPEIVLLSEAYDVPFASLVGRREPALDPDEKRLYYDRLDMAFKFVCQDKQFKV